MGERAGGGGPGRPGAVQPSADAWGREVAGGGGVHRCGGEARGGGEICAAEKAAFRGAVRGVIFGAAKALGAFASALSALKPHLLSASRLAGQNRRRRGPPLFQRHARRGDALEGAQLPQIIIHCTQIRLAGVLAGK